MLFVGEAPPASGKFFYRQDSGLYRAIRDVFRQVDSSITDENFLTTFQRSGCYLIDVCPTPVDQLDPRSRRAVCLASEPLLSHRIRKLQPDMIVSLVRSIRGNVERSALVAGWDGQILDVPYPGRWIRHREVFQAGIVPQLKSILQKPNRKTKGA
jgi:hypothetical protein